MGIRYDLNDLAGGHDRIVKVKTNRKKNPKNKKQPPPETINNSPWQKENEKEKKKVFERSGIILRRD